MYSDSPAFTPVVAGGRKRGWYTIVTARFKVSGRNPACSHRLDDVVCLETLAPLHLGACSNARETRLPSALNALPASALPRFRYAQRNRVSRALFQDLGRWALPPANRRHWGASIPWAGLPISGSPQSQAFPSGSGATWQTAGWTPLPHAYLASAAIAWQPALVARPPSPSHT